MENTNLKENLGGFNFTSGFNFTKDTNKMKLLQNANSALNIHKCTHNKLVFVYTPPKVGSTSVVSSLRIFGSHLFDIIHIHDEEMLRVLGHIQGVTVNEIILFNKYLGKEVFVIDIYRSPIERKISTFFEKIGAYHFNNNDSDVNRYNVKKVINRFNNIFMYLGNGDHWIDKYQIPIPEHFDWTTKHLIVDANGVKYIKLRLCDSNLWGAILTNIFGVNIRIVKDYETSNKVIKQLFSTFKSEYRIPINYLNSIMDCKYFNYYYSPKEKEQYFNEWSNKSAASMIGYTEDQYRIYQEVTLENVHIDYVQIEHYMDEGCLCKACGLKRAEIANKVLRGVPIHDRIIHKEAKTELIQKRAVTVNKFNRMIQQKIMGMPRKKSGKDFNGEMTNIVNGK